MARSATELSYEVAGTPGRVFFITLVGEAGDAGDVPAEHGPALVELVDLEARVPPVHLPAAQRGVGRRRPRPLLLVEVSAASMDMT